MLGTILLVGAGGFAGSVCRYLVSLLMVSRTAGAFGCGTLAVNIAGSLLIGLLMGWGRQWAMAPMVVGFCGGFTTFSAFSWELLGLLRGGNMRGALLYAVASIVVCTLVVWLGYCMGIKINR
ncbi:putative fluoride ion transporter CrcB [Bacteroidia bacterium]|nr:putative fluoride ion transporter CrcB [Bacteroidia bacterium]